VSTLPQQYGEPSSVQVDWPTVSRALPNSRFADTFTGKADASASEARNGIRPGR